MAKQIPTEMTDSELDELLAARVVEVEVEVPKETSSQLSPTERRLRGQLEKAVERAFWEAGSALAELKARELYRDSHKTFESYCRSRFGHSRQKAYFLMKAAEIYQHLSTSGCQTLPSNERQIRPLSQLKPPEQQEAWRLAVAEAGGKTPNSRLVARIVEQIQEKNSKPDNPYKVGEVCQILVRDEPELSGKNKCWAIVRDVQPRHCLVACWDGEYEIKVTHLQSLKFDSNQCEQIAQLEKRLRKFQEQGVAVEEAAYQVLVGLGKLKRSSLTVLEDQLLHLLEDEYLK